MVSVVRPGYSEMIRQLQIAEPRFFPAGAATPVAGPIWLFALLGAVFCAVPILFLVRRAPAFARNQ